MSVTNLHLIQLTVIIALASGGGAAFLLSFLSQRFHTVEYLTDLLGEQYGFIRLKYNVSYEIGPDAATRVTTIECVKAINAELTGIEHYTQVLTEPSNMLGQFRVKTIRAHDTSEPIQVIPRPTLATTKRLYYQLLYQPSLKKNQELEYSYEVDGPPGMFALSQEELFARKLPYDYISMKIAYPTKSFVMTIKFPDTLPVEGLAYDVWLGDARLRLQKEFDRLQRTDSLKVERIDGFQIVRLFVNYPILDLKYAVIWRPQSGQFAG